MTNGLNILLLFFALGLCAAVAVLLIAALVLCLRKKQRAERICGIIALISAAVSFAIYYYARFVQSGGTFQDWRVTFVTAVYAVAAAASVGFIIHGAIKKRKMEESLI